ncbi:unnamed protein product [Amoebophrya sp. A120]|nr:unnamed protein product [Amoebophrya sp. A120]|eukprot:GSA120T00005583001.1
METHVDRERDRLAQMRERTQALIALQQRSQELQTEFASVREALNAHAKGTAILPREELAKMSDKINNGTKELEEINSQLEQLAADEGIYDLSSDVASESEEDLPSEQARLMETLHRTPQDVHTVVLNQDDDEGEYLFDLWHGAADELQTLYDSLDRARSAYSSKTKPTKTQRTQHTKEVVAALQKVVKDKGIPSWQIGFDSVKWRTCVNVRAYMAVMCNDAGKVCSLWRFVVENQLTELQVALKENFPGIDDGIPAWAQCLAAGNDAALPRFLELGADLRAEDTPNNCLLAPLPHLAQQAKSRRLPCAAVRQVFLCPLLFSIPVPHVKERERERFQKGLLRALEFLKSEHGIDMPKYKVTLDGGLLDLTPPKQTQISWLFADPVSDFFCEICDLAPPAVTCSVLDNLEKIVDLYRLDINEEGVQDDFSLGELLQHSPAHLIRCLKMGVNVARRFGDDSLKTLATNDESVATTQVKDRVGLLVQEAQAFLLRSDKDKEDIEVVPLLLPPGGAKATSKSSAVGITTAMKNIKMKTNTGKELAPAQLHDVSYEGPPTKNRKVEVGNKSKSTTAVQPTSSSTSSRTAANAKPGSKGIISSKSSSAPSGLLGVLDERAREQDAHAVLLEELSSTAQMTARIPGLRQSDTQFQKLTAAQITSGIRKQLDRVWNIDKKAKGNCGAGSPQRNGKIALQLVFDYVSVRYSREDAISAIFGALLQANNEYGIGMQTCSPLKMVLYLLDGRVDLPELNETSCSLSARTSVATLLEKLTLLNLQTGPAAVLDYGQKALRQLKPKRDSDICTIYDQVVTGEAPVYAKNRLRGLFAERVLGANASGVKKCMAEAAKNYDGAHVPPAGYMSPALAKLLRNVWDIANLLTNAFLIGDHMQKAFAPFRVAQIAKTAPTGGPSNKRSAALAAEAGVDELSLSKSVFLPPAAGKTKKTDQKANGTGLVVDIGDKHSKVPMSNQSEVSGSKGKNADPRREYPQHRSDLCDKQQLAKFMTAAMRESTEWSNNDKTAKHKLKKLNLKDLQKIYSKIPQRDADRCDDRLRHQGYENIADFDLTCKIEVAEYLLRVFIIH